MNYLYFFLVNILLITCINYVQHKFNFLIDIRLKHKIKNTKYEELFSKYSPNILDKKFFNKVLKYI